MFGNDARCAAPLLISIDLPSRIGQRATLLGACLQETEVSISKAREVYRPVAQRGSLVYFMVDSLGSLDRVYHYSMANFVRIMGKAMVRIGKAGDLRLKHVAVARRLNTVSTSGLALQKSCG